MKTAETHAIESVSRRTILKRGGALAGAAALLGGSQLLGNQGSAQASNTRQHFRLEVAMDGGTLSSNQTANTPPGAPPVAGDGFIIRGRIYPDGTSAQGLSGPHQEGSIGTWICFGTYLFSVADIFDGAVPHVVTAQYFLLDNGDGLMTEGTEGGIYTLRSVVGGYGAYIAAAGQCSEREIGPNDTMRVITPEIAIPGVNLAFDFELVS